MPIPVMSLRMFVVLVKKIKMAATGMIQLDGAQLWMAIGDKEMARKYYKYLHLMKTGRYIGKMIFKYYSCNKNNTIARNFEANIIKYKYIYFINIINSRAIRVRESP